MSTPPTLPPFSSLPLSPTGPPGNAWGLWGPTDQLGTLNLITPSRVLIAAREEIRSGVRISLDLPLDTPSHPAFSRRRFEHAILPAQGARMNDDEVRLNTQSSTQWDGLRHYGYQADGRFYGGRGQEEFESGGGVLGIDVFAQNGGITGRGVLLDWFSWSQRNAIDLSPFTTGAIKLSHIKAVIAEQNISFRPGDILFLRVGFTHAYRHLTPSERENFPDRQPGGLLGLEATRESLRWLWESQFAAIASDAAGFERGPATGPYNERDVSIHQWCLAGWGMPIGELFDLEELAAHCEREGRWSFFLQSMPLKIPGGVASPANAVAIF